MYSRVDRGREIIKILARYIPARTDIRVIHYRSFQKGQEEKKKRKKKRVYPTNSTLSGNYVKEYVEQPGPHTDRQTDHTSIDLQTWMFIGVSSSLQPHSYTPIPIDLYSAYISTDVSLKIERERERGRMIGKSLSCLPVQSDSINNVVNSRLFVLKGELLS